MKTIQIIVKGKVQGVFFRQSAKEKAIELGLTGTVQNTSDGHVQITVTGDLKPLTIFTSWCRVGPPRAIVTKVMKEEVPLQPFANFSVIRL